MVNAPQADAEQSTVAPLGARLRAERQRVGLTLRSLAAAVGVSASMISQIENGKARPSVSTLYALTSRLGVTMEELFAPPDLPRHEPTLEPTPTRSPERSLEQVGAVTPGRGFPGTVPVSGAVVRPHERQSITMDTGVTWERLGEIARHAIDFLMITYPPGATSSSNGGQMRHAGAEFGFVLSGELVLTLGFDEVRLRPGDAVSFPSTRPHAYRNDGSEPAVGVWFVIERDVTLEE